MNRKLFEVLYSEAIKTNVLDKKLDPYKSELVSYKFEYTNLLVLIRDIKESFSGYNNCVLNFFITSHHTLLITSDKKIKEYSEEDFRNL